MPESVINSQSITLAQGEINEKIINHVLLCNFACSSAAIAAGKVVVIPLGGAKNFMYWQGAWPVDTSYMVGDGVQYAGRSYAYRPTCPRTSIFLRQYSGICWLLRGLSVPRAFKVIRGCGPSRNSGYYWFSTVDGSYSRYLYFSISDADMSNDRRAYGFSVRCIKD